MDYIMRSVKCSSTLWTPFMWSGKGYLALVSPCRRGWMFGQEYWKKNQYFGSNLVGILHSTLTRRLSYAVYSIIAGFLEVSRMIRRCHNYTYVYNRFLGKEYLLGGGPRQRKLAVCIVRRKYEKYFLLTILLCKREGTKAINLSFKIILFSEPFGPIHNKLNIFKNLAKFHWQICIKLM